MNTIYFDHNATTPVAPAVLAAMTEVLQQAWHNPGARYPRAKELALRVEAARQQVARLAVVAPSQVVFTSGGSESIGTAFLSAKKWQREQQISAPRVVVSSVEHSAVKAYGEWLQERGWETITIDVNAEGQLDRDSLTRVLDGGPCFVSLQAVNNETGVITNLDGVVEEVHRKQGLLHLDAVQAPGKIPLGGAMAGADYLSLAAHKFGGAKGTGALILGTDAPFAPLMLGGGQEDERRAGTLNTAGIIGMGVASELALERLATATLPGKMTLRQERLETALLGGIDGARVNGAESRRVSATTSLTVPGVEAHLVLAYLDTLGIEASAGSACSAHRVAPSPVLLAMGRSPSEASSTLRLSQGPETTDEEIELIIAAVLEAVTTLRALG